jgi:predicted O-linked N-acetylglucosamine transferase (SPINDLY family)
MTLRSPLLSPATNELEQHRRAVRLNPRDANAHALLGVALLKQRQLDEGVAGLRRALELNPKVKGLHAVLAAALFELGQYEDAAAAYRQALRFQDAADLHQGLADALVRLGRHVDAESSARRAAELAPKDLAVLLSLAAVLHGQRRNEELVALLRRVLELDPDNVDARYDLGHLLHRLNRFSESLDCHARVVERAPGHARAHRYMGLCLRSLGRVAEAIRSLERAVELMPQEGEMRAQLLADLAATLQLDGRHPQALEVQTRALALEPHNLMAVRGRIHAHFALGEWQEALRLARAAQDIDPSPEAHSMLLFILSHCCLDPAELTREHFAYGERWEAPLLALLQPHSNPRDPQRPIRVGIVSADLYHHAVARFVAPVFEALKDSPRLSLHVYYNNTIEDEMSRRLQADAASWRPIAHLDDEAAERLIRDDAIDILIDLSGHSASNRLPLFARKPAPLQATWIGYAGTTGLKAMDYILCDRFLVPDGRYDDQFSENIVNLPLGAPFLPDPGAPPVNELPALARGHLTFGSFHRASKLSRDVIAQWARLLHAVPDAKMLLGGLQAGVDDVLVDWFASEGIPRERLLLRERSNMYEYLKQHYEVDVCLSPFPYTGATTVGHALWMGVPTLTTVGATNPSHAAATFMAHLGLSTFITEDEDTWVKLGVFLSQNAPALAAMRASMRERFVQSVLGYPDVAAAGLELALRKMWQRWCAGEAAAPLRVDLSELLAAPASE